MSPIELAREALAQWAAETPGLSDDDLRKIITDSLEGRQNAYKRATRKDATAALAGDATCRAALAERLAPALALPPHLVEAIEHYNGADWGDGRDPSKLGAINAVCYIGEQVAALYKRGHSAAARTREPQLAEAVIALTAEVERLRAELNTPHTADFLEAVRIEAAHQRQRWSAEHDDGKTNADWFWLLGWLAGKAVHAS